VADVLYGDSAATYLPQSAYRGLFLFRGENMEQSTITKKVLITLDILTGEMDIEHDGTNHVELLGILESKSSGTRN